MKIIISVAQVAMAATEVHVHNNNSSFNTNAVFGLRESVTEKIQRIPISVFTSLW